MTITRSIYDPPPIGSDDILVVDRDAKTIQSASGGPKTPHPAKRRKRIRFRRLRR